MLNIFLQMVKFLVHFVEIRLKFSYGSFGYGSTDATADLLYCRPNQLSSYCWEQAVWDPCLRW